MKIRLSVREDNMFTFFSIENICDMKNVTGDATIEKQISELYRIFKIFEANGYRPQIIIEGE